MSRVSIVRTNRGVKDALAAAVDLLGGLAHFIDRNDRVMLKPNLNGVEGSTDVGLVQSLVELLSDFGVRDLFIAESTFGDAQMTNMFFAKTGFSDLAARYGIRLVNLNESEAVEVKVKSPLVLDKIRLAKEVFEADKIVNLPNMKVHYATAVSLAMKNLKGLLVGAEKRRFHEVGLEKAIVDLNNTVAPHLNIIDCISCMERMGPRGGDIVNLNLLIAGAGIAEVDYVAARVMGFSLADVKHLAQYVEMNDVDLDAVEVVGERIDDVRYPFKRATMQGLVPPELTVRERNACSACMNALLLSCQLLPGRLARPVDVYLGSLIDGDGGAEGLKIAFGNCCPAVAGADKVIRGCPPYPYALGECLKGNLQ